MGIHDRDWYQEWWAKKEGITKSEPREPEPRFRPITPPSPWARVLLKTTVHLLAVFGFLTLVKKYLVPLL